MNPEDTFEGSEDGLLDFDQQADGSALDHLVPADERVEPAVLEGGKHSTLVVHSST